MADQDKERNTQTMGQQTSPGILGSDPSSSTQQRSATGTTGGMAAGTNSTDDLKNSGKKAVEEAKGYTKDMAEQAKEKGRSMFDEHKGTAAEQVDSAAHAFRNTAKQLEGEGQSQASHYVGMFAEQLESLGSQLRHKNIDSLLRDAENLGRRSPGVFLAGSVAAGFLLARFLKSSAEHRHESSDMSRNDWRSGSDSRYDDEQADALYGSSGSIRSGTGTSDRGSHGSAGGSGFSGSGTGTTTGSAHSVGSAGSAMSGTGSSGTSSGATSGTSAKTTLSESGLASSTTEGAVLGNAGSTTSSTIGADGTGSGDKAKPTLNSSTSNPGGNTYGNR